MKKYMITAALVGTLLAGVWGYQLWWGKPWNVDHFYEVAFAKLLLEDPETLTMLGMIDNTPLDYHSGKLGDISPDNERAQLALVQQQLDTLQRYELSEMTRQQQLSAQVMAWYLQNIVDGEEFLFLDYPVNQMTGWPSELPTLFSSYHALVDRRSADVISPA